MTQDNRQQPRSANCVDEQLARHGALSYLEIPAVEVRRSAAFYANVFGWNVSDGDSDNPKFADQTGHLIGRWVTGRAISLEPGLLPYIYVDRIDDVVKRVVPQGGEILREPYCEGNLLVATVRDPAGNVIGLWQERDR
jgi:predicted enzyme related to lactoylglutathione lyase